MGPMAMAQMMSSTCQVFVQGLENSVCYFQSSPTQTPIILVMGGIPLRPLSAAQLIHFLYLLLLQCLFTSTFQVPYLWADAACDADAR
jgi:hypothetical protein